MATSSVAKISPGGAALAALDSRNEKDFGVGVEFTNDHIPLLGDVGGEIALRHFLFELRLDLGKTVCGHRLRVPLGQRFVSASTNHSKFSHGFSPYSFENELCLNDSTGKI